MKFAAALLFIGATCLYLLCGLGQVFGMVAIACDVVALALFLLALLAHR
jgi:hypothetical protein